MAELIGPRHRGRRKEQLRLTAAQLAATVTAAKGEKEVTVVVAEATTPKGKPETVTFSIPKGAALVPYELTAPKAEANAREQIRLGAKEDAEANISIASVGVRLADGTETAIFYMKAGAEKE